jgi:hypothetical protein
VCVIRVSLPKGEVALNQQSAKNNATHVYGKKAAVSRLFYESLRNLVEGQRISDPLCLHLVSSAKRLLESGTGLNRALAQGVVGAAADLVRGCGLSHNPNPCAAVLLSFTRECACVSAAEFRDMIAAAGLEAVLADSSGGSGDSSSSSGGGGGSSGSGSGSGSMQWCSKLKTTYSLLGDVNLSAAAACALTADAARLVDTAAAAARAGLAGWAVRARGGAATTNETPAPAMSDRKGSSAAPDAVIDGMVDGSSADLADEPSLPDLGARNSLGTPPPRRGCEVGTTW